MSQAMPSVLTMNLLSCRESISTNGILGKKKKNWKTAEGVVTSYLISPDSSSVVMSQPYEAQGRYVSPGQPLILLQDLQQETPLRRYLTPRDFMVVEILFFYSSGTKLIFTGNVDPASTVLRLYSSSSVCN